MSVDGIPTLQVSSHFNATDSESDVTLQVCYVKSIRWPDAHFMSLTIS